eukprot:747400-Hanusia_phi.AAC.2
MPEMYEERANPTTEGIPTRFHLRSSKLISSMSRQVLIRCGECRRIDGRDWSNKRGIIIGLDCQQQFTIMAELALRFQLLVNAQGNRTAFSTLTTNPPVFTYTVPSTFFALTFDPAVNTNLRSSTFLATAFPSSMVADSLSTAVLAATATLPMLADPLAPTFLTVTSNPFVHTNPRASTFFALSSDALVLTYSRSTTILALPPHSFVLTNPLASTILASSLPAAVLTQSGWKRGSNFFQFGSELMLSWGWSWLRRRRRKRNRHDRGRHGQGWERDQTEGLEGRGRQEMSSCDVEAVFYMVGAELAGRTRLHVAAACVHGTGRQRDRNVHPVEFSWRVGS